VVTGADDTRGRDRLGESVYRTLRQALLTGEIRPGSRVGEELLAERLGVSRTPVREALRRLESDGLVQRYGKRLTATPMGADDIGDIGRLRVEIDTIAASLLVERASAKDWAHIGALAEELAHLPDDPDQLTAKHLAFHRSIYAHSFGPRLSMLLNNHLLGYLEITLNAGSGRVSPASLHREHLLLVRALSSGDPERAEAVARHHASAGVRTARRRSR
jgi:DNA-binding GntR family transcriptional regulator